jgi:hypothetical protein
MKLYNGFFQLTIVSLPITLTSGAPGVEAASENTKQLAQLPYVPSLTVLLNKLV